MLILILRAVLLVTVANVVVVAVAVALNRAFMASECDHKFLVIYFLLTMFNFMST